VRNNWIVRFNALRAATLAFGPWASAISRGNDIFTKLCRLIDCVPSLCACTNCGENMNAEKNPKAVKNLNSQFLCAKHLPQFARIWAINPCFLFGPQWLINPSTPRIFAPVAAKERMDGKGKLRLLGLCQQFQFYASSYVIL